MSTHGIPSPIPVPGHPKHLTPQFLRVAPSPCRVTRSSEGRTYLERPRLFFSPHAITQLEVSRSSAHCSGCSPPCPTSPSSILPSKLYSSTRQPRFLGAKAMLSLHSLPECYLHHNNRQMLPGWPFLVLPTTCTPDLSRAFSPVLVTFTFAVSCLEFSAV